MRETRTVVLSTRLEEDLPPIPDSLLSAVKNFDHPNLVKLLDVFSTGSAVYEIVENVFTSVPVLIG